MSAPDRVFTIARHEQGFASQAHLDAFFLAYDHGRTCPECQREGSVWLEGSASWQPVKVLCPEGRRLFDLSRSEHHPWSEDGRPTG